MASDAGAGAGAGAGAADSSSTLRAGKEVVKGRMFMCVAWSGAKLDERFSQLQKMIRRGRFHEAAGAALDILLTGLSGRTSLHKAILTRLGNRLIVMVPEDVGVGFPQVAPEVQYLVDRFREELPPPKKRTEPTLHHLLRSGTTLLQCVQLLCACPKQRLVSDMKTYACLPPFYKGTARIVKKKDDLGNPLVLVRFKEVLAALRELHKLPAQPRQNELHSFSTVIAALAAQLADKKKSRQWPLQLDNDRRAEEQSDGDKNMEQLQLEGLFALGEELNNTTCKTESAAYRDVLLEHFHHILGVVPMCSSMRRTIETLRDWTRVQTHKERPIYLIQAYLIASRAVPANVHESCVSLPLKYSESQLQCLVVATQNAKRPLEKCFAPVTSESLDKHTAAGRRSGASCSDFATKGAVVTNEVGRVQRLRDMYVHLKTLLDGNIMKRTADITVEYVRKFKSRKRARAHSNGKAEEGEEAPSQAKKARAKKFTAALDPTPKVPVKSVATKWDVLCERVDPEFFRGEHGESDEMTTAENWDILESGRSLVMQRCTARHKPPTYMTGKFTFKGPYKNESPAVELVMDRTKRFMAWGNGDFVLSCMVKTDPSSRCRFLVYPTVGGIPALCQDTVYYQWDGGLSGLVAVRDDKITGEGVQLVSKRVNELGVFKALTEEQWLGVFQHLLLRFVMNCGDTGLWNVIYDPVHGRVFGVDFEDNRSAKSKRDCAWDCLFTKHNMRRAHLADLQAVFVFQSKALRSWLTDQFEQAQEGDLLTGPQKSAWEHLLRLMQVPRGGDESDAPTWAALFDTDRHDVQAIQEKLDFIREQRRLVDADDETSGSGSEDETMK